MSGFEFHTPGTIVAAAGAIRNVGTTRSLADAGRVLLVTDAALAGLGFAATLTDSLREAGKEVLLFDAVEPEPSFATTRAAVAFGREHRVDAVVGLGGGSPMDVAKLAALLIRSPQELAAIVGVDRATGDRLPLVLIPTTAGTGSEVTKVAVVTADDGDKSPILAPQLYCDTVVLDVELTLGLPPKATADTGVDAMVHAIEAYTSRLRKNPVSDQLALQAMRLLFHNLLPVVVDGTRVEPRAAMLTGSMLAGLAFANATVGAVHALAYPIGTLFSVSHGSSNAVVLTAVMRFNCPEAAPLYAEIARAVGLQASDDDAAAAELIAALGARIVEAGLTTRLRDLGVEAADISRLAEGAGRQERLLSYNHKPMQRADLEAVFRAAL